MRSRRNRRPLRACPRNLASRRTHAVRWLKAWERLMDELEQSRSYREIVALKAKYFRFVDSQRWDELAQLFTDDARLFFPENQAEPGNVADSIAFFRHVLEGAVSVHHGHMPEIEFQSPTEASGIWAMEDRIYFSETAAARVTMATLHGFGHYHEEYRRVDAVWRIHRLKLTRIRSEKTYPPVAYA
jgi:hypothetical protein